MSVGTDLLSSGLSLIRSQSWDDGVASGFARTPTTELFANKKVVVFGLPGAFTGVCTQAHVPGYSELAASFKAKGVASIICVSVNDPYSMNAWKNGMKKAAGIDFFADSDGTWTKKLALELDLNKAGLGPGLRSTRYSMIVDNGKVTAFNVEANPGAPPGVSSAESTLKQL